MPKQKTDDLIQLIKSLTRAEKRHFRLFVRRNQASEDILFLQLFDVLDKYQSYDEPLVLKKIPEIKKRQLSNLKAHLYKQLLMSLRLLGKNHHLSIQLREQIDYAQVLYSKGLYQQSLDILEKTKKKAIEARRHDLAIEAVEFEKHIEGQYITRSIETRAEELTKESIELDKISQKTHQFSNLALQLYGLYLKVGFVRNKKDYYFAREFFKTNLPEYNIEELGFYEKLYLYQSYAWYYHMTQDFPMCYRYGQKWVDLFHDHPEMIDLEVPLYLKSLHNLLNVLFNVWHYEKFEETLEELLAFKKHPSVKQDKNVQGLWKLYKYIHTIKKHYIEGTFTEGTKLVPELMKEIESDANNWDDHRILVFYYRIACMYFGMGDYDNAITYLNLIINQRPPDYRADIQAFSRILNLISHFELGNQQLVEYQVKSVYRFLGKLEDLHQVQKEIFKFLRKLSRVREDELKKEFVRLKANLEKLGNDPYERRPYLYLDIISWLRSKIEGRTVEEIVKENFRNNISPVKKETPTSGEAKLM